MKNTHYPSLFLLLNVHSAIWYRVEENKVEQLAIFEDEKDRYQDREGFFGRTGTAGGRGEPDVINARRKAERDTNFKDIAAKTVEVWKADGYKHLIVALHERFKNIFTSDLAKVLKNARPKFVFGNRTKAGKKEILEMFKESLKVV